MMNPISHDPGLRSRPSRARCCWGWFILLLAVFVSPIRPTGAAVPASVATNRVDRAAIQSRWESVSLEALKAAAERGDPGAQFWLGWRYGRGLGVPPTRDEANKWMRSAADQGLVEAQYQMGLMAELEPAADGQSITGNYAVAAEWFQKAAEGDHADAMLHLGDLYYYGKLGHNHPEAAKWFRRAADQGQGKALLRLGELYRDNRADLPQDHAESARWFRLAAKQGDAEAEYSLGLLLLEGVGIPHDVEEAEHWLAEAARQGHGAAAVKLASLRTAGAGGDRGNRPSLAQLQDAASRGPWEAKVMLGQAYEEGWDGTPDYAAAARAYELALNHSGPPLAGQVRPKAPETLERLLHLYVSGRVPPASDHAVADLLKGYAHCVVTPEFQFEVGEIYERGRCVPADPAVAVDWYTRAAKDGSTDAINRMGELWATGQDGQPDPVEAAKWYRRAAGRGLAGAQFNLGRACLKGEGIARDPVEAGSWLDLAARQNHAEAARLRGEAELQLTPEQLAEARKRAATRQQAAADLADRVIPKAVK